MTPVALSEILYVDEAAKTANDAVAMDYALFVERINGQTMYVLVDTREARSALAKVYGKMSLFEWLTDVADVIKGMIVLDDDHGRQTVSVSNSAAIGGYGPLLYELAMSDVSPRYLVTDSKVTPAALNVWTKFYERSDVGKVAIEELFDGNCAQTRPFLNLAANHLRDHMNNQSALTLIQGRLANCSVRSNKLHDTDMFMKQLGVHIDLKYLPMLFAYSTPQNNGMAAKILKNEGKMLAADIMQKFRLSKGSFLSDLHSAATHFFNQLYRV